MFNVGGMELVVICVVALIVLGPDKLPGAIREVGRWAGELRRISQGFQADFRTALADAEREVDERARQGGVTAASGQAGETSPSPRTAMSAAQAELDDLSRSDSGSPLENESDTTPPGPTADAS